MFTSAVYDARMSAPTDPGQFAADPTAARRERRPLSLSGFVAGPGGMRAEAKLLDLSYEGCGIETALSLAPGEAVTLTVNRLGVIAAEVCWVREGKAGLAFSAVKAAERPRTPRASQRRPSSAEITIRRIGQANYRVGVRDLSPSGCKIDLIDRPRVGEQMMVKFEGLEILEAEVCWVEDYFAGLKFARAMHPAVFDLLMVRLG